MGVKLMNKAYLEFYPLIEKWVSENDFDFTYYPESKTFVVRLHLNLEAVLYLSNKQLYLLGDFKDLIHTDSLDDLEFSLHSSTIKLQDMHNLLSKVPCLYHIKVTYHKQRNFYQVKIVNLLEDEIVVSYTTRYLEREWQLKWFPKLLTFNDYCFSFDSHARDDIWKTLDDFKQCWEKMVRIYSK